MFYIDFRDEEGNFLASFPTVDGIQPPVPDVEDYVTFTSIEGKEERYEVVRRDFTYLKSEAGPDVRWYNATITVKKEEPITPPSLEEMLALVNRYPWYDFSYQPAEKRGLALVAQ